MDTKEYAFDIDWITDGQDIDLPSRCEIPESVIEDAIEMEDSSVICDWLSDEFEFLVNDFDLSDELKDRIQTGDNLITIDMIDRDTIGIGYIKDGFLFSVYADTTEECDNVLFERMNYSKNIRQELKDAGIPEENLGSFEDFRDYMKAEDNLEPYIQAVFNIRPIDGIIEVSCSLSGIDTAKINVSDVSFRLTDLEYSKLFPELKQEIIKRIDPSTLKKLNGIDSKDEKPER